MHTWWWTYLRIIFTKCPTSLCPAFKVSALGFFGVYLLWISSVQSLSHVQLFATPWISARQASLSITNSQSSVRLMSIESVMPSSHLILCCPLLLLPQSLPASESFPMSQLFAWGGQSIGVSVLAQTLKINLSLLGDNGYWSFVIPWWLLAKMFHS